MMGEFDWGVIWKYREVLWDGMLTSLKLFAIALAGGIFFGTLLALARLSRWKALSVPAAGFVNLIRAIPFIMAIFWFYFLTPMLVGKITGQQGEAVGVVAEEVAIDQYRGDIASDVVAHTCLGEQALREGDQRVGAIAGNLKRCVHLLFHPWFL